MAKAVAVQESKNALPADFNLDDAEIAGLKDLGYSEDANDSLVPILAIVQDNSGEAKKGHSKRMEGAIPGMGILRSMKKLVDLENAPISVIPVGFKHEWVQWRGEPGEGKIITQYPFDQRPAEARDVQDPQNKDKTIVLMPNGDRLVDTRYHYVIANIDENWAPLTIPMGGTNHTVSRIWTGQMKAVKLPSGVKAPSWFKQYSLGTKFTQDGSQSWYKYEVNDLGWVTDKTLRDLGRALNESLLAGTLAPDQKGDGLTTEDEGDSPI